MYRYIVTLTDAELQTLKGAMIPAMESVIRIAGATREARDVQSVRTHRETIAALLRANQVSCIV